MLYDYKNVNKYIQEERFDELIRFSEQRISMQFEMLLKLVREKDSDGEGENLTDLLMVTGPSASGKTTTSNLLAKYLSEDGYNCTVISLDDYYFDAEVTQRKQIEMGLVPLGTAGAAVLIFVIPFIPRPYNSIAFALLGACGGLYALPMLSMLLYNLTENAIKACKKGGKVKISCSPHQLVVEDNGKGMTPEQLTHITEPFYRSEGGAGLGMALCKQIAEAHKAVIRFESVPEKGTKITVDFTS